MRKHIKTVQEYIVKQIKSLAARACLKLFLALYSRQWTGVQTIVGMEANRKAKAMLDGWLTGHGFLHCARCLGLKNMRRTMVEVDDRKVYLCADCYKSGLEAGAIKPTVDLVKP